MKKLLLLLLLAGAASAGFEGVRMCSVGESCVIDEFVFNDDWSPAASSATCNITVRDPDGVEVVSSAAMTQRADGYYNYSISYSATGKYTAVLDCADDNNLRGKIYKEFIVDVTNRDFLENLTKSYRVEITDFGELTQTNKFKIKAVVFDYKGVHVNASSVKVTLYDPSEQLIVEGVAMTQEDTGVYAYNYTTSSSSTAGVWYAEVVATVNGNEVHAFDYFEVESSPAEVRIIRISDSTVPSITAVFNITNEGSAGYEYTYQWWVDSASAASFGDSSNIDSGQGAKYINSGETWNSSVTAVVPKTGVYYFYLKVFYGTESSQASRQFIAVESGGGGGGISSEKPVPVMLAANQPSFSVEGIYPLMWLSAVLFFLFFVAGVVYEKYAS